MKPGGKWINFGPLLYHWRSDSEGTGDSRYDASIELSWEELRTVIEACGFRFLVHKDYKEAEHASAATSAHIEQTGFINNGTVRLMDVPYTKPFNSLMWTQYRALFFTCERI